MSHSFLNDQELPAVINKIKAPNHASLFYQKSHSFGYQEERRPGKCSWARVVCLNGLREFLVDRPKSYSRSYDCSYTASWASHLRIWRQGLLLKRGLREKGCQPHRSFLRFCSQNQSQRSQGWDSTSKLFWPEAPYRGGKYVIPSTKKKREEGWAEETCLDKEKLSSYCQCAICQVYGDAREHERS